MRKYRRSSAKIIGLTGGFGTGKSYVAGIFRSLGARVIDADKIAHDALKKSSGTYRKITAAFGPSVLDRKGNIDRKLLARAVFGDRTLLKKLNTIIHPGVIRTIKSEIRKSPRDGVIVIDAPLLIEAGLKNIVNKLVVVTCTRGEQIRRCCKKFGINKKEVLKRVRSQMPLSSKVKMADYRINNGAARAETRKEIVKIWRRIVWK